MTWLEALILGIVQGLTEFLPVSSSGHIELGKAFMDIQQADNLTFSVVVHVATALSTVLVFRSDIFDLLKGVFAYEWNDAKKYALLILISMVPVFFVGVFLKDSLEAFFNGNLVLVGSMLLLTAGLLVFTKLVKPKDGEVTPLKAILIGIAQAIAVLPGISRSGATIATALYLGIDRAKAARFSFLMVIPPILGAGLLDAKELVEKGEGVDLELLPIIVGFLGAFVVGVLACRLMIRLVQKGGFYLFGFYCLVVGATALTIGLLNG